jgi:hypothetical protein
VVLDNLAQLVGHSVAAASAGGGVVDGRGQKNVRLGMASDPGSDRRDFDPATLDPR